MKFNLLSLTLLIGLTVSSVSAQKISDKPFQKWSQEDAAKVLNNSPWVKQYQSDEGMAAIEREEIRKTQDDLSITGNKSGGNNGGNPGSKGRDIAMPVITIRLHSALPVRQAFVRLQELNAGYDKMDKQKQAEFDEKMKNNLECNFCQKFYIVTMNKSVNASGQSVDDGLFQTMNFEQLKGNVWLINSKGEKDELAQFIPPKGGKDFAILFFERKNSSGNEFITPQDKTFRIEFNGNFLTSNNPYAKMLPKTTEFKVSSILVNEAVAF